MADYMKFMQECKARRQKRRRLYYSDDLEKEIEEHFMEETGDDLLPNVAILVGALNTKPPWKRREHNKNREIGKMWWDELYTIRRNEEFKEKICVNRKIFNTILDVLKDELILQATNLNPSPTSPDRQLALALYMLAHGCTYSVLEDLFAVSIESGCVFFNKVCRLLVAHFYDDYVKLPETDEEWEAELRGFIENYGFPCVGAWDGSHVHVSCQLISNYSFKKKYTVNNLALASYNKRFLYAAVGGPGSAHDARMLKESSFFDDVLNGEVVR